MKILNFGSLNIDYIYEVDHFVMPGETISSHNLTITAGGKGLNQSIALSRAGLLLHHAGAVGNADGEMLRNLLEQNGIDTRYIDKQTVPSGHAIIQVNQDGQNCIVLFGGANQLIDNTFVYKVLDNFSSGDVLLLQNEISSIDYIIEEAHKRRMKIFFNPSPADEKIDKYPIKYIDTLILNEVEGEQLTGKNKVDDILDSLLSKYPEIKVVLTLGENGAVYADKHQRIRQGIFKSEVVDTTAAGDTFTGYFISGIVKDMDVNEALRYASAAASIAVSRLGAACSIPILSEVKDLLSI